MDILKTKLGHGQSYPLMSSVFAALLDERRVNTSTSLHLRSESWWTDGVLFRADFYPPGWAPRINQAISEEIEKLHVTCRLAPSNERHAARIFLEESVLPAFADWILGIERLAANSTVRREKLSFTRSWAPADSIANIHE